MIRADRDPAQTLLVRAADAGDTYLSWRWLDEPAKPDYEVLLAAQLTNVLGGLDAALVGRRSGSASDPAHTALVAGAFADPVREHSLACALTDCVLPARLRREIADRAKRARVGFRITPSPRLARVPWELLCVDEESRLIEVADVTYDPPAAVHAGRSAMPDDWSNVREHPAVLIVDPVLPAAVLGDLRAVLTYADGLIWSERLVDHLVANRISLGDSARALHAKIDRGHLSVALKQPRSRLLYFGHVTAAIDQPGSAAIHLDDTTTQWGVPPAGVEYGDHRPLTALDLLLGTRLDGPGSWTKFGSDGPQDGHELWPMPSRVAIIACEGGADYRSMETFGLVIAMINSGAELVTTTRWILPSDNAFRSVGIDTQPASELGLRVDAAHELDDPLADLTAWQVDRLDRWRSDGDLAATPLVWASLTHTLAPRRD
ncbi:hypothetical protein [Antrihabitans spumae]|uniref:CHAT domain-containing protein n=1 Tax=Antrihabitans spumae TaxID=3373370 RepID=A0ABW7K703_9NOCA